MTGTSYLTEIAIRLALAALLPFGFYAGLGLFATGGDMSTFGSIAGFSAFQLAAPIAALVFIGSILGPTRKRLATLGVNQLFAFVVPVLIAADARLLLMVGGPPAQWMTWEIDVPVFAIVGLVVIFALGLARSADEDGRGLWQRNGMIGPVVFAWVGIATLIGLVGLGGGIDTGLLPSVTGGFGSLFMPSLAAEPAVAGIAQPALSFRPLTPIQLFAAGAGVALLLLVAKDRLGPVPPDEERGGGSGSLADIDPLKVVLQPLPKTGSPFLRSPDARAAPGRNVREQRPFGRRQR